MTDVIKEISKLKTEKKAVILAHYYQIPEVQDLADFVGDSYYLSVIAQQVKSEFIVFAGVRFMAETAKVLNPNCKVLIPDIEAGCSLSDSCDPEKFAEFIKKHPDHVVVTYINSSIEIKAMSDVICTSSNAEKIIRSFPKDTKIIFAPDKNLGTYLMKKTGRKLVLWDGTCHVHNQLHIEQVLRLKMLNPDAKVVAHPECQEPILQISDFVGSTSQIIDYCLKSKEKQFIIATETGITHQLKKNAPDKEFIIVPYDENCHCNDCNFMKLITPEKILKALKKEVYEIIIPDHLMEKALKPLKKMIELTGN